jgi:hypothetical protein
MQWPKRNDKGNSQRDKTEKLYTEVMGSKNSKKHYLAVHMLE